MARKLGVGIQNNMRTHYATGRLFDDRTTEEVEKSRDPVNKKPYRNKLMKAKARSEAFIAKSGKYKGTYVSYVPREVR